jgi:hypothetical protein
MKHLNIWQLVSLLLFIGLIYVTNENMKHSELMVHSQIKSTVWGYKSGCFEAKKVLQLDCNKAGSKLKTELEKL